MDKPHDLSQLYLFTTERFERAWKYRSPAFECQYCGGPRRAGEFDPCLADYLRDVAAACCGHGMTESACVVVSLGCRPNQHKLPKDRLLLTGDEALAYFESLGVGPRPRLPAIVPETQVQPPIAATEMNV